jgi:hypothetical protein
MSTAIINNTAQNRTNTNSPKDLTPAPAFVMEIPEAPEFIKIQSDCVSKPEQIITLKKKNC